VEWIQVPTLELAKEVGSERTANMVMIGVVCAKAGLLTMEETITGMRAALKGREKLFKINEKGIERGFAFAANGK
jgi:2-oxoglutarate ferredoxin oxidoreductase subunit gamma